MPSKQSQRDTLYMLGKIIKTSCIVSSVGTLSRYNLTPSLPLTLHHLSAILQNSRRRDCSAYNAHVCLGEHALAQLKKSVSQAK